MKNIKLLFPFLLLFAVFGTSKTANAQCGNLYIAGVIDGPLSGGTPKGVQLCASGAIADLSIYAVGSANNGLGTDGEEFTFPADALNAGDCVWLASEGVNFQAYLGFAPCYTDGTASINGDDAIELFCSGAVVDIFGDINCDPNAAGATCQTTPTWEHTDSWAVSNDALASTIFAISEWTVAPINALDGTASNAAASTPYPNAVSNCPMAPVDNCNTNIATFPANGN